MLQDILRLLTLWFNHGATSDVQMALQKGFLHVKIEMWLAVLPQIIARIHSNNKAVRELIQSLLVRIGKVHPQVFSLSLISNYFLLLLFQPCFGEREYSIVFNLRWSFQGLILWFLSNLSLSEISQILIRFKAIKIS